MAVDVVPGLLSDVRAGFENRMRVDKQLARIAGRIRDGTATLVDAHRYAERLGIDLSKSLMAEIVPDVLPNGELYFNIAERIITPTLRTNYEMANETAAEIQSLLDAKNKIGLEAVKAEFPEARIRGLADKLSDVFEPLQKRLTWLGEPVVNNSEAFVDDFIRANAQTRSMLGMKTTITRIVSPGCCEWCDALAGTYNYGEEPDDIYRRHEFCRCDVIYQANRTSQNVWSKKQWQSTPEELEARRNIQVPTSRR